jgi:hypothetical protein
MQLFRSLVGTGCTACIESDGACVLATAQRLGKRCKRPHFGPHLARRASKKSLQTADFFAGRVLVTYVSKSGGSWATSALTVDSGVGPRGQPRVE